MSENTLVLVDDPDRPDDFFPMHEGHDEGYLAISRTDERIRLYCCDNCGGHHWGRPDVHRGFEYTEYDFAYSKPNGDPYLCAAKLHELYGGPEYCMGACWPCERETRGVTR